MASSEAHIRAVQKYNANTYTRLSLDIPKDLSVKFKAKCSELGISQRAVILEAIENFIENE